MAFRRGRQTFRQQQRELAEQELAHDQTVADAKLADPSVPQLVKDGILKHRAWAAEASAPKRHRVVRPVDGRPVVPYERDIQKACLMLLRVHPKVACVWRQNSGTFTEQNTDGSMRYISAHTMPGLPDILGFLKGGRMFCFEVKRPGQRATPLQQIFIDRANDAGALAAVIHDADELPAILG
jgi:hypothetical protein